MVLYGSAKVLNCGSRSPLISLDLDFFQ